MMKWHNIPSINIHISILMNQYFDLIVDVVKTVGICSNIHYVLKVKQIV
jgi:hypothetical protein